MPMPFNADEIFEMAQQIERNGAKFYRAAAKKISAMKETFLELADMEDEHLKTFTDMRSNLSAAEKEPLVFDPDSQAAMYLQVMANGHVFDIKTDPTRQLTGRKTAEDILKMAIGLEKDSIVFYSALKESVSRKAGKDKVEAIIAEEMSHIVILGDKLASLK
jgi:rubrerythrin